METVSGSKKTPPKGGFYFEPHTVWRFKFGLCVVQNKTPLEVGFYFEPQTVRRFNFELCVVQNKPPSMWGLILNHTQFGVSTLNCVRFKIKPHFPEFFFRTAPNNPCRRRRGYRPTPDRAQPPPRHHHPLSPPKSKREDMRRPKNKFTVYIS